MARTIKELQNQYQVSTSTKIDKSMPPIKGPGPGHGNDMKFAAKPKNARPTIKRLLTYLSNDRLRIVLVIFMLVLSTLSNLIGSYMLFPIINRIAKVETTIENSGRMAAKADEILGKFRDIVFSHIEQMFQNERSADIIIYVFSSLIILATVYIIGIAGAERVFALIDSEPEASVSKDAIKDNIEGEVVLKDVSFAYDPDQEILKGISVYAHKGQKIAFVGSTGAGKTTITNLLNRFYDIKQGDIFIDGISIFDYDRDYLRQNIAMVLQDTHLFTETVMENIRYGRLDATDEEVIEAAKTSAADSFIMRLSDGYQTVLEGDGANLSQGQRQLINIARAAISKAPILVLDEATSSVDTRTEKSIQTGMDYLMKNRTTFVIAHRLSTVRNSNAIMVLENGEIIERGTHKQLLDMKGRYYELYTGVKELD